MARPTLKKMALARQVAANGVDFSPRTGATCPWCGRETKITKTMPWDETIRIRYHRCRNKRCVLAVMGVSIKSIEVDRSGMV